MENPDLRGAKGFSLDEVLHPGEDFLEHMLLHGMLAAGTTGVQGVAPKFLLRTNADGIVVCRYGIARPLGNRTLAD